MLALFRSYNLCGLQVTPIQVEVEVSHGMPYFSVIGMAGTSVQEAKERVRSALKHSGFEFPMNRKIVNLAPAALSKRGSHFDLPIALGLLVCSKQMPRLPEDVMVMGELGLEGGVKGTTGVLPALLFARKQGVRQVIVPYANIKEASLVDGVELIPVTSLKEVVEHFGVSPRPEIREPMGVPPQVNAWDLGHIRGQAAAKRALMVAAAGGHHVLLSGPPGTGKSLLARAFTSLLPPLSKEELIEVLQVHSIAGRATEQLHMGRPFRPIHHSTSSRALIGGGMELTPGEISFAHRGILFMDELPEFPRRILDRLRQPLEEGEIHLKRGHRSSVYPCQFQLIAAMNPCLCGYYGDAVRACACHPYQVQAYQKRISGPLLDRMDLCLRVPRIDYDAFRSTTPESVESLKRRKEGVEGARARALYRLHEHGLHVNREMTPQLVQAEPLDASCQRLLQNASREHALSTRALHKLIKVARTIADLEGQERIKNVHLMEAFQYRLSGF